MSRRDLSLASAIFAGGALGAVLRVAVGRALASGGPHWPWATFLVNVGGSALLGHFATRLQERLPPSTYPRPLLGTGLCGALTTFSTFQLELLRMGRAGDYGLAVLYTAASVAACFGAVFLASGLTRRARLE